MYLPSQEPSINELKNLADNDKHSVIIEGIRGCGKTYLSKMYADMLSVGDFRVIEPRVSEIKEALSSCFYLENKVMLCIENLQDGNVACSHVLLKFMEEPKSNVYVVITCDSFSRIPDTLVSRSMHVVMHPTTSEDLELYCKTRYPTKYESVSRSDVFNSVLSLSEADKLFSFSNDQLDYVQSFSKCKFNDSISSITWKLGHFDDNSEAPVELIVRYIMNTQGKKSMHVLKSCIECLNQLSRKRVAQYLIISKLAFDLKYCE